MSRRPSPFLRLAPWLIALLLGLTALYLGQLAFFNGQQLRLVTDSEALARLEIRSLDQQLEADAILARHQTDALKQALHAAENPPLSRLRVIALAAPAAARAVLLWDPLRRQGLLVATGLPLPPADQSYRLWINPPGTAAPLAAAVFRPDSESAETRVPFSLSGAAETLGVCTLACEPTPDSSPAGPPVPTGP